MKTHVMVVKPMHKLVPLWALTRPIDSGKDPLFTSLNRRELNSGRKRKHFNDLAGENNSVPADKNPTRIPPEAPQLILFWFLEYRKWHMRFPQSLLCQPFACPPH